MTRRAGMARPTQRAAALFVRARDWVVHHSHAVGIATATICMMAVGPQSQAPTTGGSAAPAPPTSREADERLTLWLERQGFDRLLAAALEERLTRETADIDRRDLAERLRDVVIRRIRADAIDPDSATTVAESMRPLLPAVDADELQLEILRARQRLLERRIEQWRLGDAEAAPGGELAATAGTLAAEADRLRRRLERDVKEDDQRLDRSVGLEAEALLEAVERKRQLLETARFVQAWMLLHQTIIVRPGVAGAAGDAWRGKAMAALEQFIALLDTGREQPKPDDVAIDRLGEDPYASAVLGTALCQLLLDGVAGAAPWFALLEDTRTAPAVRRSAPGWRLLVLLASRDFVAAKEWLDRLVEQGGASSAWLRLALIECRSPQVLEMIGAQEFVQAALAALAAQDELGEVLALAEKLPASALPSRGFVVGYLRGMRAYAAARAMDEGAADVRRDAFRAAATALRSALAEPDAARSPLGQGSARQLAGWCLVGAGDFAEASVLFEQAAQSLPAVRAAESLWLAAEAIERAAMAAPASERGALEQSRQRMLDLLLERHPESAFALRAEVSRIRNTGQADADALARLRAVPRGSPAWIDALAAAEEILYRRVRSGRDDERRMAALEYLETARSEDAPDASTRRTWLRRRAEVALVPGVERLPEAMAAVTELRARATAGEFTIDEIQPELQLRDLQLAALDGRLEQAMTLLRSFEELSAETLVRLGRRSILRAAQRQDNDASRMLVVDVGAALLAEENLTIDDGARHAVALAVGQAALALSGADSEARLAKALDTLALARARRPSDLTLLELTSGLAERAKRDELALECLRAILAGTTLGERAWFDARLRQVRVLARSDPKQARRVLDQHRALIPEWGPEPWGAELRALDRSVPSALLDPEGGADAFGGSAS